MDSLRRKTYSLRSLVFGVAILCVLLACYVRLRSESLNQLAIIAKFESCGGAYHQNEEPPFRLGQWLGFKYPLDTIRVVKGPGRSDWWGVPGWQCTDNEICLIEGFSNLETIYISNSELTDSGLRRLATLRKAQRIQFAGCNLSRCNLEILANSESISNLELVKSDFNQDSLTRFQKKRPNCQIFISAKNSF